MIVNYKETGWEVITQRAHGLLAAQVGIHWKASERPHRWVETLISIADHDDAEVELDGESLLTEAGGPLNFSMKSFDLAHCRKLSMLTITKSRFIALLASKHMEFLYRKEAKTNSEARQFLKEQSAQQKEWRKQLGLNKKDVDKVYNLLEWCDAFSLLLCRQQMQPEKRGIEISTGLMGQVYELFQDEAGVLTVKPWPFDSQAFTISYESREIAGLKFESSAAFRKAFIEAPVKENIWKVEKKVGKVKQPSKSK